MTKPRPRREQVSEIDEVSWRYLNDATTDQDREEPHCWLIDTLDFNLTEKDFPVVPSPTGKSTEQLWKEYGDEVIRWWIKDQPGTRPRCWWRYSAPEPRRRIGGTGMTRLEVFGRPKLLAKLSTSGSW